MHDPFCNRLWECFTVAAVGCLPANLVRWLPEKAFEATIPYLTCPAMGGQLPADGVGMPAEGLVWFQMGFVWFSQRVHHVKHRVHSMKRQHGLIGKNCVA